MKSVTMDSAETHVVSKEPVVSMPTVVLPTTGSNVYVLRTSLEILKLNVLGFQVPALVPQTVLNHFSAVMEFVCQAVPQMKAVLSMRGVFKAFACVSFINKNLNVYK